MKRRSDVLRHVHNLPAVTIATNDETLALIEQRKLAGSDRGFVDASLLASLLLTPGATLWTKDGRLDAIAKAWGVAANPTVP